MAGTVSACLTTADSIRPTVDETSRPVPPLQDGPTARTLQPIPGEYIDPPDVDTQMIRRLVDRYAWIAWSWRWWERFRDGYGTLSAKGIAFYGFFSLLSALALMYGFLLTYVPAAREFLDQFLQDALPGIVGKDGIDPDTLAESAGTVGLVGAAALLYSALAVVRAIDSGVRLVYGVQYNPRGLVIKSLRQLGWVTVLVPVLVLSYAATTFVTGVFTGFFVAIGVEGSASRILISVGAALAGIGFNAVMFWILLSRFTGVTPSRGPRAVGTLAGAVAFEIVKLGSTFFIGYVFANPRYNLFAIPIALLLLFFAMAAVLLAAAALTATLAEPDPVTLARRRQPLPDESPLTLATAKLEVLRSTADTVSDRLGQATTGRNQDTDLT